MLSTAEIRKSGVNPSELRDMEYRKKNAKRWAYVSVLLLCMRCNKVRTTGLMYCCKSALMNGQHLLDYRSWTAQLNSRWNISHNTLQQLEAVRVVQPARYQALLHDRQHIRNLSRCKHALRVTR